MATKRKLAAILFVDIAGFTDRANRDESLALRVKDAVEKQFRAAALIHHGRVVKMLGDGAMLEFASAVEAVSCALAIQDSMKDVNRELALEDEIQIRIGVHAGDVVEEDADIFGNAVNIASRVQGMATPGKICITREVFQQIRPILNLRCTPVSARAEGRMPEPVEVLQIDGGLQSEPSNLSPSRPRYRLALGLLGALAAVALAVYWARPAALGKEGEPTAVHRILLPDWVSPGEWFEIDAGPQAGALTVYFGNRKAESEVREGKLMVQTPTDLPSERTTISVFQDQESKPMMAQATHIVRPKILAATARPVPSGALDRVPSEDPEIVRGADTKPAQSTNSPAAEQKTSASAKPGSGSTPPKPNSPPDSQTVKVRAEPIDANLLALSQLDKALEHDFEEEGRPALPEIPKGPAGPVIVALRKAKAGDSEETRQSIEDAKKQLEGLDPGMRKEIEALIKTAEALAADHPGKAPVDPKAMGKWAEAFAFSMNSGARGYSGIAMVDRMIRAGKKKEARRVIDLMRKRPDLTEGEIKSLDRLEKRLEPGSP